MPSLKYGAGNEEIQWPWTQNKSQRTGAQIQPNQLIKGCANYMFEKVLPSPLKNYRSKFMSLSILKHMQGCVAHICFFMFTTVVIVFQSIHWNNKNHKQHIHSTIHHLTSTDSGQEPNPASWAKWTWKEAQRFLFKQLKLISSLIQKFCFLKLCKKNEAFCVLIFSCAEDVVDLMKTVTLFPNFNHMIATLTSAMTN